MTHQTQQKSDLNEIRDEMNGITSSFQKMEMFGKEIKSGIQGIGNKQITMSNEMKKQEIELNRLKSDAGRPGIDFFYKLTDVNQFFELKKQVYTPVFAVKGIRKFTS